MSKRKPPSSRLASSSPTSPPSSTPAAAESTAGCESPPEEKSSASEPSSPPPQFKAAAASEACAPSPSVQSQAPDEPNETTQDFKRRPSEPPLRSARKLSDKVIVINHEERLLHPVAGAQVLTWMPGVNRVERRDWDALKNEKFVTYRLDDQTLEFVDDDVPDLTYMPPRRALALIRKTVDRRLLREWEQDEKRPSVQKALDDQLHKVAAERSSRVAS